MGFKRFFHPHFVIKEYLYRDIKSMCRTYRFQGRILDIGCGEKPYHSLFSEATEYVGIDYKNYSKNNLSSNEKPDVFFPAEYGRSYRLPFRNQSFDHTVAFQVSEHHPNPFILFKEASRVTKTRGYLLFSMPFINAIHESPHDYFRYTEYALRSLLQQNNYKVLVIKRQGAIASTITTLLMDSVIELAGKKSYFYVVAIIIAPVVLLFTYFSLLFDLLFPSKTVFLNYVVLAQKR